MTGSVPPTDVVTRARAYLSGAPADPALVSELVAELERLKGSEWAARGERDSMKRRLELLTADESWWIGGAWGDYGEVVIPVRALHMVLGQKMEGQDDVGEPELDPGLAATYRDLRASLEAEVAEVERLRNRPGCCCGGCVL